MAAGVGPGITGGAATANQVGAQITFINTVKKVDFGKGAASVTLANAMDTCKPVTIEPPDKF